MADESTSYSIDDMLARANEFGLRTRGFFEPAASDAVPCLQDGRPARTLVLFGNVGSSLWPAFSTSPEYVDTLPHPLDRWSNRIGNALAREWGGMALYPFGGPPWHPFQRWAKRAEALQPSKLGILMHPELGLWHAYRFAIALPDRLAVNSAPVAVANNDSFDDQDASGNVRTEFAPDLSSLCLRCAEKPCLKACPVNALDNETFTVSRCVQYLQERPESTCLQQGCQARTACPVGLPFRYNTDHAAFHMHQFLDARIKLDGVASDVASNED